MAKNDATAANISIYMDIDPVLWRRYNYTCGLRNTALAGMILVSLLFVPLAAVLLCRLPGPASARAPAPAADDEAGGDLPTLRQSVSVVWSVSLLLCFYLSFWIYTFSRTMGAAAVFSSASRTAPRWPTPPRASSAPPRGSPPRTSARRQRARRRRGRRAPSLSEEQMLTHFYCVFMSSLFTQFLAARVVWLVFFPSYGEGNLFMIVLELSGLMWWILYFWATHMIFYLLHEALVSRDFILRVLFYYMGSMLPVAVLSGLLLGPWFTCTASGWR